MSRTSLIAVDLIAVDWGTTNRRAYALDASGAIVESFEDDCGILSVPSGGFDAAVAQIRDRLGDAPMLLAGMVGSNRGWRDVPYVSCPATISSLGRGILRVDEARAGVVPGLCQRVPRPDVMRGEEVQILGAVAAHLIPADATVCHPGTHAKWMRVDGGAITAFRTAMVGELFALLRAHSILADQLGDEAAPDAQFVAGVRAARDGDAIAGLFSMRARRVLGEPGGQGASYASGLLIGADVRAGLADHADSIIWLIGRPELCALYAAALAEHGRESRSIDGADAFIAGIAALKEVWP